MKAHSCLVYVPIRPDTACRFDVFYEFVGGKLFLYVYSATMLVSSSSLSLRPVESVSAKPLTHRMGLYGERDALEAAYAGGAIWFDYLQKSVNGKGQRDRVAVTYEAEA